MGRRATRGVSALALLALPFLAGCVDEDDTIRVAGQIEAIDTTAGSRVGGRVLDVLAEEGDPVEKGSALIRLDDAEAQAAVAAAEAQLAAREAALDKLVAGATEEELQQVEATAEAASAQLDLALAGARDEEVQAAAASLEAARAQREVARTEFERIKNLHEQDVASRRQYEQAEAALESAEAQFNRAREQSDLVLAGTRDEEIRVARANSKRAAAALAELRRGPREEDIAAAAAARDAARADLARARTMLEEMTITAPLDAVVEALDLRPGDLVQPGPAVRLVDPEALEVVLYVSATLLGHLSLQQEIAFTADAFGEERFTGHITQIAAEGEFTPRNLQTEEERVQQVFGVTVALDSHGGRLRPGMSVTALLPKRNGAD